MKKQNKYIVFKNQFGGYSFKAGYVEYHRDLTTTEMLARGLVAGGGLFKLDEERKVVLLYGKSDDFGFPKEPGKSFSECYGEILKEVENAFYYGHKTEVSISEYGIAYIDEKGVEHVVKGSNKEMQTYHGLPKELIDTRDRLLMQSESVLPRVSKHRGGRFEPKNAEKKKKAKRRAQKKARRK